MMGVRLFAITVLASTAVAMGCGFAHRGRKTLTLPIWRNAPKSTGLSQALLLTPIVGRAWSASAGSLPPKLNSHHLHLRQRIVRRRPVALIALAQQAAADFQLSDAAPSVIELAGDEWPTLPERKQE